MFPKEIEREKEILKLSTRRKVYKIVLRYAGSHFREIERKCKLPHGVVKYHLDYMSRHNVIRQQKIENNVRYFPKNLKDDEKKLLGLLRSTTTRQIIIFIDSKKQVSNKEIVEFVNLSAPTISWHIKRLTENGIIKSTGSGNKIKYSLNVEKNLVIKLLIVYRESFFDSLVDKTVEMWG